MKPPSDVSDTLVPAPSGRGGGAGPLEVRIHRTGEELLAALRGVLDAIPGSPRGPQALATRLGIDKVLASRILAAVRSADPLFVVHRAPGPEPLRRTVSAIAREGVDAALVLRAERAVDDFERLIRDEIGDRQSLEAIVSAWVPEARREFELRRKQSAFKALSHLRGAMVNALTATVFLAPSADDPERLDVVWVNGLIGLLRLRPSAAVKLATRRFGPEPRQRQPLTLDREPIERLSHVLGEFSSSPLPPFEVVRAGDTVHYVLGGEGYGPRSAVDLVMAEVNLSEMRRTVPAGSGRKGYVFAEVSIPAAVMQLDAFVHEGVYPGATPSIRVYDTAFEGVADANDRARDIDALDVAETVESLGTGLSGCRSADVPRYTDLLRQVCARMRWSPESFRGYRCRVEYPLYGTQVTMLFDPAGNAGGIG